MRSSWADRRPARPARWWPRRQGPAVRPPRGGRRRGGSVAARDGSRTLQRAGNRLAVAASTPRPPEKLRTARDHDSGGREPPETSTARRARLSYDAGRGRPVRRHLSVTRRRCPSSDHRPEEPVPQIRPFRALRYVPDQVGDLGAVVAPPYDVLGPADRKRFAERHPRNVVRLDAPADEPGDAEDDRYRRAARTLAAWRSDGTFHKDPRPSIYVHEQTYRVPGTDVERTQRGFFARLRLEPLEAGSGVLPHERTLAGPREDRYRLLRATGVNTSPVVGLYDDPTGQAGTILASLAAGPADIDVLDDDGTRHRVWVVAADGPANDRGRGAHRDGGAEPGDDRRRPPPLRDRAPLSRRASDGPLLRGGSGVRLPPDAVPRGDGRAADGAPDAPPRGGSGGRRRPAPARRRGRAVHRH